MLGVRPSGEIGAALADEFERQRRTQAMNLRQVHAENRVQGGPRIEGWRIGRVVAVTSWRQAARWFGGGVSQPSQHHLDLRITIRDLGLIGVIKFQRLAESKDVLLAPVSGQRCSEFPPPRHGSAGHDDVASTAGLARPQ